MHSPDLTERNIDKIAELFPSVITENLDDEGNPVRAIDFDLLRQELTDHVVEGPQERYQLDWPGKRQALFAANAPIAKTLRPVREESVAFDTTGNLFIEGDNLEALKLLQESYLGKVKLIYIDPPYNTGNDFVYEDDFAESTEEYLSKSRQVDDLGNRLVANLESNGRFHSDWLSMMYPRLKLARNLLTDDGIIFVSIDDNEVPRLRQLCDEIFGWTNFVATFVWEKRTNRENRRAISYRHDYILCYTRQAGADRVLNQLPMNNKALASYSNPDDDPRGLWKSDPAHAQAGHATPSQFYDLIAPTGKVHKLPSGRCWAYTKGVMEDAIRDGRIWFGKDGNGVPRIKTYLHAKDRGLTPETILFATDAGTNESAKNDLKNMFDGLAVFDTPKPVELLRILLQIGSNDDSLAMDFFAGSGTFAHAVMAENRAAGGSRRFIVVQVDEAIDPSSEAGRAGYGNLADLAKDRIRRAGRDLAEQARSEDESFDAGFRVLRADSTNFADVLRMPDALGQDELNLYADSVKPDRTGEDLLFQVLLDWGLELTMPIAVEQIEGHEAFIVEEGALIACFDGEVSPAVVRAVAKREPLRAVFRDSGFATDSDRINAEQVFAEVSPATDVRAI